MRSQNKIRVTVVLAVVIAAVLLLGIRGYNRETKTYSFPINLGLDLKGGVYVVLAPTDEVTLTGAELDNALRETRNVISNRIDEFGVAEPTIQLDLDNDRILVQIPGVRSPDEVAKLIGRTAQLTFEDIDGNVLLVGSDVKRAQVSANQDGFGGAQINLSFTDEGSKKFAEATTRLVGQQIIIKLDEEVLLDALVSEAITHGGARVTGRWSFSEARDTANLINAGALPVPLERIASSTVGPTLGSRSIKQSLNAGIIGIVLVLFFMFIVYRSLGLLADIALVIYGLIALAVFSAFNATLTLPGIAGFILAVGMAVDANVIVFERIKDEIRSGRSVRSGIDAGFNRALLPIFDSNITTLIAAGVLFYFGTAQIRGFAVTLSVGIFTSLFTALYVTRTLIELVAEKNPEILSRYFAKRG
ncbi:MAG: protein translocase subunit SecD [Firmicutes bacterium]|nr:protein translocase subunit SecD [Bacillota bacterium]MDD4263872.1 protein translocase subunit SecD [Bacillota bacterium]MDD4692955.1 protein translocase subunit SecD [Bacillota bacterium]